MNDLNNKSVLTASQVVTHDAAYDILRHQALGKSDLTCFIKEQ